MTVSALAADDKPEFRTRVKAGTHLVSVSFVDTPFEPEGLQQPLPVDFARGADEMFQGLAAVDTLTIQGPFVTVPVTASAVPATISTAGSAARGTTTVPPATQATASRRAIFVCTPPAGATAAVERACASRIVSRLAQRAYRRKVETVYTMN